MADLVRSARRSRRKKKRLRQTVTRAGEKRAVGSRVVTPPMEGDLRRKPQRHDADGQYQESREPDRAKPTNDLSA